MLLLLLLMSIDPAVYLDNTEIYTGVRNDVVFFDDETKTVTFFVRKAPHFRQYREGKLVNTFGVHGQGPAELDLPRSLGFHNFMFYAKSGKKVVIYDRNGGYIKDFRLPNNLTGIFRKLEYGWLSSPNPFDSRALFYDETFNSEPSEVISTRVPPRELKGFDPSRKFHSPFVDKTGKFIFWPHPTDPEVVIFSQDDMSKFSSHTVKMKNKRIPFIEEWGDQQLKSLNKKLEKFGVEERADYPRLMPAIRWSFFTPEGYFAVRLWGSSPEDDVGPFYVFDHNGNKVKSICNSLQCVLRVIHYDRGFAYILDYSDEEMRVMKVMLSGLETYLAENPLEYLNIY